VGNHWVAPWSNCERHGLMVSISSTFLRTNFLYECHFGSFFWLRFGFGKKNCTKNPLVKRWWNWRMIGAVILRRGFEFRFDLKTKWRDGRQVVANNKWGKSHTQLFKVGNDCTHLLSLISKWEKMLLRIEQQPVELKHCGKVRKGLVWYPKWDKFNNEIPNL